MSRRGTKRKYLEEVDENKAGWSNFQAATRRRESMRLKSQICATPGIVEKSLKDKIQVEMSLVEGTAKFILACKNQTQTLEAAKTLLISRMRSDMLKFELTKLRRGRGSPPMKMGKPSYAGMSISDIRIPLLWKRKEHLHDMEDTRQFAVFCVARIGSQIYDTTLVNPVDRHCTDVTLPDVLLFSKVPPYFEFTLEVYAHELERDYGRGITSTPQKICRSIGRAVGRSMMNITGVKNMKDFESIGPKFELVASANLTLEDCHDEVRSHELYVEDFDEDTLPLFGQLCCRLATVPYCCEEEVLAGSLTMSMGKGKERQMWASLIDWKLALWNDKSDKEAARQPDLEIPITRETRIQDKDKMLSITNKKISWIFTFDDKEVLHNWLVHLIQHSADHRSWKQAASSKMQVLSPQSVQAETRSFKRTRSRLVMLYNDID